MSYVINIPVVSPNSGALNDGALKGQINETLYKKIVSDSWLAGNILAYTKDASTGSFIFKNVSTEINSDTANDVQIFGSLSQMGVGDEIYICCDSAIHSLFFKIGTSGIWNGSLEFKYSSNGITANGTLQNVVDNTNRFTASPGVYSITFNEPSDMVDFSPVPGEIPSKKWIVIRINSLTSVTTVPIIDRVWVRHKQDQVKYTDLSTGGDIAPAPSEITTAFFPVVDSSVYYCTDNPSIGQERYIFKAQSNVITRVLEYLATDNTWKPLQGVFDSSNDFTSGPLSYSITFQKFKVRWNQPTDWTARLLSFTLLNNVITSETGYWFRIRTTSVSVLGPATPVTVSVRAKQLGNSGTSGDITSLFTTKRISITRRGTSSGSGNITFQLYNFTKNSSISIIFPDTDNNESQNYDIQDLAFADGDKLGVYYSNGNRIISDIELIIHN